MWQQWSSWVHLVIKIALREYVAKQKAEFYEYEAQEKNNWGEKETEL